MPLPGGEPGLIYVRGEQIAGEYATGSVLDDDGWFCTRDRRSVDVDGYPRAGATVDGEDLRAPLRSALRGSKTPDAVVVRDALPHTETGMMLRRVVLQRADRINGCHMNGAMEEMQSWLRRSSPGAAYSARCAPRR